MQRLTCRGVDAGRWDSFPRVLLAFLFLFPEGNGRRQECLATTVMEETILSRIERLDHMLKQLEEIRGVSRSTPKSTSGTSTPSSGDVPASPSSMEKHCRPINRVIMETEVKGTLVDRLDLVESRIMKVCLRMEEELEVEKKRESGVAPKKRGGLKRMFHKLLKAGGRRKET